MEKEEKELLKHYDISNVLSQKALYNLIWGERSNGKTFQVKYACLFGIHNLKVDFDGYLDNGQALAVVRRWEEDFKGKNGASFFDDFIHNEEQGNIIEKKTKGKWNSVYYINREWYLQRVNKDGEVEERDQNYFAKAFSLNMEEHYKSNSYPRIGRILFDEFITRHFYLIDEPIIFSSVISTIVRNRNDIIIFMCGNTISPYNPYFAEYGLKRAKYQKKGTIDVYKFNKNGDTLLMACEYSDFPSKKKPSNVYFAFDNPKLEMVTSGKWEVSYYPHLPREYRDYNVIYKYYIVFDGEIFTCKIILLETKEEALTFTYIHRKTKPINENETESLVFTQEYDPRINYCRKITNATTSLQKRILAYFLKDKVFYQDNEVGETIRQYLQWCKH